MIDRIKQLAARDGAAAAPAEDEAARLGTLWIAAAELLLATGAGATLEQLVTNPSRDQPTPRGLAWAPLLLGPLAAAANLEHARHPTDRSETAVRFLTGAAAGVGAALFLADSLLNRDHLPRRVGPLAFASAGLLGLLLQREEGRVEAEERALRRRARVVERLVPRRQPRIDRIVVHV